MGVNIEFKPGGQSGIVADGTYLQDAARRLGVRLPMECEGRGKCDTCAVVVEQGATLLSTLTAGERKYLSPERLATGERLACQVKIERGGDLVLRPVPATERQETSEESVKDFGKEFREMPLKKKLSTLVGLEAVAAYEALNAVANLPYTIIEKGMSIMAVRGRTRSRHEREARRPTEHRAPPASAADSGETDGATTDAGDRAM